MATNLMGMPTIPVASGSGKKSTTASNPLIGSDGRAGVYWRDFTDGSIYTRNNAGQTVKVGGGVGVLASGDQRFGGLTYREIDPIVGSGGGSTPTTTREVSGGGGSQFTDTSAARGATQASIDSLDEILRNNLTDIDTRFKKIGDQYTEEETLNKTRYGEQVSANENNRTSTVQQALLSAAQGGRGLMASLAALGALGGDGSRLANRAVAQEANRDIGDGNRVFEGNATQLNNAYVDTQADEKRRRTEAEDAAVNERRAAETKIAEQRQSLFERMATLFTQAGDNASAARYLGMVGEQAPIIARNSAVQTSPYKARNIGFEGGELKSYLAGRNDMTVKADPLSGGSNAVNSPLYSLTKRREEAV